MPPSSLREGLKILEKSLLVGVGGGSDIFILVGVRVILMGGGHEILKQKLKLHHNTIIKSISGTICHKCLEHSVVFPAELF